MSIEAMERALEVIYEYVEEHGQTKKAKETMPELRQAIAEAKKQKPVAMTQVYRCKIKSRKQIDREISRDKQGWWADISAGQLICLRQATKADLDRCTLNEAHSKDPEDYMCETHTNGSLVSKVALEYMNAEQNVFAAIGDKHPQPKRETLTDEQKDIINFLLGASDIDDVWFGDKHPTEKGQFWWRNRLDKAFQGAYHNIKEPT